MKLLAACGNEHCINLVEYESEGGCPPLACSPQCKEVVEEEWAEVGDGYHFPRGAVPPVQRSFF